MRRIAVLAAGFVCIAFASAAQCDGTTTWMASTTEFINSTGEMHSKSGAVTVTTDKENFHVVTADGSEELKGKVSGYVCNWKDSANGNISFKSELTDKRGEIRQATIAIEAKDGKITLFLEAAEEETKIRLPIDRYEVMK
jgi:hypothetical protein